jgi:hypothetical protein
MGLGTSARAAVVAGTKCESNRHSITVARPFEPKVRQLCAFDEAHDDEQEDCPNGCNDDATYESAAKKLSEQEAAENRANDAHYEIADEAKPSTLDEDASQPTRHHTNNEKPDNPHFESPVSGQGGHRMTRVAAARGAGKQKGQAKRAGKRHARCES